MSRRQVRRAHRARIRRNMDEFIPIPRHPYRDSAIFYCVLSACLVGIASVTGAGFVRGLNRVVDSSGKVVASVLFTDFFVYRNSRWQAVAGQETMVADKK